ncbi:hypothetical protein TNCV_2076951 [Trichonephila clavipes]|nr:hypothetical protein TNCV_2076951 [Trichonephila clavipes]
MANRSQDWKCQECGYIRGCLKSPGVETSGNCDIQSNDTKLQSEPINNSTSVENVSPNDEYSGRESDSENSSSTSCTDFTKNIPGNSIKIASSNEGAAVVLRQRNLDSNEYSVESMQPNTSPVQSVRAKSAQNNYSLIVIWVISLILVLLIIRRWFSFDYTV